MIAPRITIFLRGGWGLSVVSEISEYSLSLTSQWGKRRKISLKLSIQSSLKSGLLAHNSLTLQKMFNITTNVEKHKAPLGMNNITFSFTCFFFTCCLKVGKCAYQFHRGMPYHAEWCNPHHTLHQKKCKNTQTVCLLCVSDI